MTTKFRDQQSFNHLQMEAALCAWEWMCENRDSELLRRHFGSLGASAMRHCAMQAGDIALLVHSHMELKGYEFADAYDWELVPGVLQRLDWDALTIDNQFNGPHYTPAINDIFVAMVAADKAGNTDPRHRSFQKKDLTPEEYIAACRAEAERQWGYGDLVSDHAERVTQAMEADEDPAEFIRWLGEKYDLIRQGTSYNG